MKNSSVEILHQPVSRTEGTIIQQQCEPARGGGFGVQKAAGSQNSKQHQTWRNPAGKTVWILENAGEKCCKDLSFFSKCLWPHLWAWWRCFISPLLSGFPSAGPFCFFTWLRQYFISPSSASSVMAAKLILLEKCFSSEHTQVLNSRSTHQIQYFWVLKSSGWLITLLPVTLFGLTVGFSNKASHFWKTL